MKPVTILFGTVTGNAASCAAKLEVTLTKCGIASRVVDMRSFEPEALGEEDMVLVVTSTTGNGDPPYNAASLHRYLHHERPPLKGLRFAVFALGSRHFTHFAQCGRDFDEILGVLGAERIVERVDCDGYYADPLDDFESRLFGYFGSHAEDFPDFMVPEPPPPPPPPRSDPGEPSGSPESAPRIRTLLSRVKRRMKSVIARRRLR
ncbi:MAG: hypothetical protein CL927_20485 [Deltaproteobacteria bacterium]|nr:hypothetical protein [Deltaproteobacteria bacterium]HCH64810.1 hypothetical protein [Deltaproteobacteria bacterium]